ncbi:MAG TPA: GNAT family N-acetyltransferase [Puia sp.]|nr:GNAT family N-acetyltransferase [Puia sp.]
MQDSVTIRLMRPSDLDTLGFICRESYSQNFGHHWEPGGLEEYLEKVFGAEILSKELQDNDIQYYVAYHEATPIAFMKLHFRSNLPGLEPEKGIELDKLYILPAYKGLTIGRRMMSLALGLATAANKEICWLIVIDTNRDAITFYEKYGFRFHSAGRVPYPRFREELKGMWRMGLEIKK